MAELWNYQASFVRAIDGDTVEVNIDLGFDLTLKTRLRLAGVDTPERGESGYHEAKEAVHEILVKPSTERFPLYLTTAKGNDKYGRYLAVIDASTLGGPSDLSQFLIDNNLGVVYTD